MSNEEEKLQSKCTQWFWNTFPQERRMLFHVDNNSYNQVIGAKKKALGVVQGVSDLVLIVRDKVIFIELKKPGGVQTLEQLDFEGKLLQRNHSYVIVDNFESFKSFILRKLTD